MDERRQSTRPSALPRPQSRLPLPRSGAPSTTPGRAPSRTPLKTPEKALANKPAKAPAQATARTTAILRPSASRDSLGSRGETRNPPSRPSISRDQIQASAPSRSPAAAPRQIASRPALNRPISQTLRSQNSVDSLFCSTASISRRTSLGSFKNSTRASSACRNSGNDSSSPGRSLALTKRPPQRRQAACKTSASGISSNHDENSLLADVGEQPHLVDTLQPEPVPNNSLNDRTIETLSRLPFSPAVSKTSNSFFADDKAMRPKSRSSCGSCPASSHLSDDSGRPASRDSRGQPGSSSGVEGNGYVSPRPSTTSYKSSLSYMRSSSGTVPAKRGGSVGSVKTPPSRPSLGATPSRLALSSKGNLLSRSLSAENLDSAPKLKHESKKMLSRPPAKRQSPSRGIKKPSVPTMGSLQGDADRTMSAGSSLASATNPSGSSAGPGGTALTTELVEPSRTPVYRKTSAALREQIAKAKAAKKAASRQATQSKPATEETVIPTDTTFDFGLADDPFNVRRNGNMQKMLRGRIEAARTTGRLNIAAMELKEIPDQVMKMYDLDAIGTVGSAWAESVDLTRFVVADNELEEIADNVFPDCDLQALEDDEDGRGNIFGGLETLDMHGNLLLSVPIGVRRLEMLTCLNLSSNRLSNNALQVISQIRSLRDLKLANNNFSGPLDASFVNLASLEIFDLHRNNVSALPAGVERLSRLRVLNISENSFECLPFASLCKLPLTDINARKNKLSGILIDGDIETMSALQALDLSSNQITHLVPPGCAISLPAMHQLTLSMNRLQELPDVSSWTSLLTMIINENGLSSYPPGFFTLDKLRHADFSSNDIKIVPPEIARMDNLATLKVTGNPLREKKFASMTTEDMKAALAARLEPLPHEVESSSPEPELDIVHYHERPTRRAAVPHLAERTTAQSNGEDEQGRENKSDADDLATPPTCMSREPARSGALTASGQTWPIKPGGILDRSNTESSSLHPVVCSRVATENRVYEVQIHHNLFSTFPNSLSFFAETLKSLCLSHNQFVGEVYLAEELELPALQELNLASNHITGLGLLMTRLRAPALQKLDVSMNRIVSVPRLRDAFPNLVMLLVANNHMEELDPESIRGMEVVDASSNDIAHLNPKLGLLGGSKGSLKKLEVTGNRFRVPRWNVLERGTEATLKWLRSRVPMAEMAKWKREYGGGSSSGSNSGDLD